MSRHDAPHRRFGRLGRATRPRSLAPLWRERLAVATRPGWARTVLARRVLAAALVVLAAVLAVRGDPSTARTEVVVAARDLQPGQVLTAADLATAPLASAAVPDGAFRAVTELTGRTAASAVRAGEALTDVRVLGPALTAMSTRSAEATSVPVRLSDPDVADLLRPGDEVTVLALGERSGGVRVLAEAAVVLLVAPAAQRRPTEGRLVVLGLPPEQAGSLAAASLESAVTVTFR